MTLAQVNNLKRRYSAALRMPPLPGGVKDPDATSVRPPLTPPLVLEIARIGGSFTRAEYHHARYSYRDRPEVVAYLDAAAEARHEGWSKWN